MSGGGSRSGSRGGKRGAGSKGRPRSKQTRGGKQQRSGKPRPPRGAAGDRDRPFWGNAEGEAEAHRAIERVRLATDPTAIVRSLGSPPLGRFAGNAQPVYAAVYERAQRLAVSMATANGLLVVDDGEPDPGADAGS